MLLTFSLQSGSNGNCIFVQTPDVRLLFDAGISGKQAFARLAAREVEMASVDALIISHDHSDHVSCAGVFHRKYRLPLYMTHGSWQASHGRLGAVAADAVHLFAAGHSLTFGQTVIETVATAHDGKEGVAFIIRHGKTAKRLGIFTDLGHCFSGLTDHLDRLDALYLESNYDPDMLENGPYPYWLKQRIRGSGGHLSNEEAAQLARDHGRRLQWLCLAHLSEHNNHPELAYRTARRAVGDALPLTAASRFEAGPVFTVRD